MNDSLSKDGKTFVDGIVAYLRRGGKQTASIPKVETLLTKISSRAKEEKIAYVESAVSLTNEEKTDMQQVVSELVEHDITLSTVVNKKLVAGFRIKIADFIIDTSYVSRLSEMAALLVR